MTSLHARIILFVRLPGLLAQAARSGRNDAHGLMFPVTFEQHINLKKAFAGWKNIRPCGMSKALELMRLPLVGQYHRAIDDARNIAKLAQLVLPKVEADDVAEKLVMPETIVSVECWVSTNQYRVSFPDPAVRQQLKLSRGVLLIVAPLDNRKVKDRGRLCRFEERRDGMPWVEFLDNGEQGRIHWADLGHAPVEATVNPDVPTA